MKTPAQPPVGHRNARQGGNGNGGGDAGYHLEGDARRLEGQSLLAASAKDEGIAPLESGHPQALTGQLHQVREISSWGAEWRPSRLPI